MKNDIKNIEYNLSKAEESKIKKDYEKQLLNELKQDIKNILLSCIQAEYYKNNSYLDILNNEYNIKQKTLEIIQNKTILKKDSVFNKERNDFVYKELKIAKYGYDELFISELIENEFYKQYNAFKRYNNERAKLENELAINKLVDSLDYYYKYLQSKGFINKAIIISINNNKIDILNEVKETYPSIDFNIDCFNKALKIVENNHKLDLIENNEPSKKETKLSFWWKAYGTLVAIEKVFKL